MAIASAELEVSHPQPGWATYDPVHLWAQTVRVLVEVSGAITARFDPVALAVSSMGETGIALDARGAPVYPAIAWYDSRTTEQADWWKNALGSDFIFSRTAGRPAHQAVWAEFPSVR